ncbi:hypothetical protein JTB14_020446 [Gonioctena quinquepunctata]|nr:hypothetical protein JTB14_020446 [Gonioctena quinquepunctata]
MVEAEVTEADLGLIDFMDEYHPPLEISFTLQKTVASDTDRGNTEEYTYNFKKGDFHKLYHQLSQYDWGKVLVSQDTDELVDSIFAECLPKRKVKSNIKNEYPIWYNAELKIAIRDKQIYFRKSKRTSLRQNEYRAKNRELRTKVKTFITQCEQEYLRTIESNFSSNSKEFWSYINKKRKIIK